MYLITSWYYKVDAGQVGTKRRVGHGLPVVHTLLATAISSAVYVSFTASHIVPTGCLHLLHLLPDRVQW